MIQETTRLSLCTSARRGRRMALAVALMIPLAETFFETGLVPRLPTAVLAIGLIIIGFLSFLAGLILDVVATMRSEMKRLAYLSYAPVSIGRS